MEKIMINKLNFKMKIRQPHYNFPFLYLIVYGFTIIRRIIATPCWSLMFSKILSDQFLLSNEAFSLVACAKSKLHLNKNNEKSFRLVWANLK